MAGKRTGFIWLYALIVLFSTGIIELLIMPAIEYKLMPTLRMSANMTLNSSNAAQYATYIDTTAQFMHYSIYTVMLVIFIYMLLSLFTREENEYYQP